MGFINDVLSRLGYNQRGLSTNYILGQKGAVWINTDKPYELYNSIPQLKTVIDKKASMFSNMELLLRDIETGQIEDDSVLRALIQNPNPLQSMNEWLRQYKTQEQVYGNQFIYQNKPSRLSQYPSALWNISPKYIKPVLSGRLFDQTKKEEIITRYEYIEGAKTYSYETINILYSKICDLDNPIVGTSPIESLKKPLSNIDHAYTYRNVIMSQKGAIGMITNETKDAMGGVPLKEDEKTALEKQYRTDYGISEGQARIIISEASLKWQPMSYPTKDLLLFEEVDANMMTIIDHFGLNANIFSSKNATFENVKNAIIQCYQDTIQPEADQFTQALGKFIGIPEGKELVASYEYLAIMKENKQKGMAAIENIVRALTQSIQSGLLSGEQAEIILANELGVAEDERTAESRTLNSLNRLSPLVANNVLQSMTTNERRALAKLPTIEGGEVIPVKETGGF
jgi:HK97 family phage portal protein